MNVFSAGHRKLTALGSLLAGRRGRLEAFDPSGAYLALLRIDEFDRFTRWHGAPAAEAVMRTVEEQILAHLDKAQIGRSGRGVVEFAFPAGDAEAARAQAVRLLERIEAAVAAGPVAASLHAAVGLAALKPDDKVDEAVARAERALELTQASAARCAVWTEHDHADAMSRLALARDLRTALAAEQLWVAYQPKLKLRTGAIDSAEALVRWQHPEHGTVPPDAFVTLAEESGDIARLTRFVLARAIEDQAALAARGHDLLVYVNLSGRLVADEHFCSEALSLCAGAGGRIGLEITETAVFTHPDRALANLHRLAEGGVPIAIDDYGSGLSSLAYLKQLPATELKIDKLFISTLTSSHRDPLLVRSTIDLAHALEMEVTAEGVDQGAALALLKVMGCDPRQGYHIARPLPLGGLFSFLDQAQGRDLTVGAGGLLNIGGAQLNRNRV